MDIKLEKIGIIFKKIYTNNRNEKNKSKQKYKWI